MRPPGETLRGLCHLRVHHIAGLTCLKPTLPGLPPRLGLQEQNRDARRRAETPWRAWYDTMDWQRLRAVKFIANAARHGMPIDPADLRLVNREAVAEAVAFVLGRGWVRCEQTGVELVAGRADPRAATLDHIVPHRGNPALFWREDNLQVVAKHWHDSEKQRQEAGR